MTSAKRDRSRSRTRRQGDGTPSACKRPRCGPLLLGLVGCLWADGALAQARCPEPLAHVVSVQGTVEVRFEDEVRWRPAELDQPLCVGDSVRVGQVSRAALAFANESVLRLDELTTLRLRGVEEERRSLLDLVRGAVHFFSHRPRALEVDTPFVNAAAEGTEFLVRVAEDRARLVMLEGRLRASNAQGELLLAAGDAAVVPEDAAPRAEIVARPRDAVAWTLHYPPVLVALAEREPRAEDLPAGLRRAVERVAANDYPGALEALDAVPEAERDVRYWTYRAGTLLNVGRVEAAAAAIERALGADPDSAGALAQRAIIGIKRNATGAALEDARRAVELAPDSAPARIALSYARQAEFRLEEAREVLREAVERAPEDALARARLAEIELSFGDLDAAEDAAEQAVSLAPGLARTQTVLGFANLTRIDIDDAKAAFRQAIELDSADPLPRLGLGLALIRQSDLEEGRREIEIAAGLDPNDALVRSYLGKAYFEEKRDPLAADQFAVAKQLDPNDPTPYFYDAIRKQLDNRPVEALRDLETAIELNDNRAVYRSRLLLDQDLATRSVSLARIYDDLGFDQVALNEATRSLSQDPSNWSAHRFLSDTYARLPRHEIARASELLQAQLLQPININPVQPSLPITDLNIVGGVGPAAGAFNEFHPLFERNRAQLTATGVVGNGDGNEDTFGDEVVASGVWDRVSLSAGQLHYQSNGFRPNNDLETDLYNIFGQAAVAPQLNLQTELRYRDTEQGDLRVNFDPDLFSDDDRRGIEQTTARVGLRFSPRPDSDILASLIYTDRDGELDLLRSGIEINQPSEQEGYQVESQYILHTRRFDFIAGGGYYNVDESIATRISAFAIDRLEEFEVSQENGYVYTNIHLPRDVVWTVGLGYQSLEDRALEIDEFSPKFGLQWDINQNIRLRAAAFEVVKPALVVNQTIEPTQIAGFNQFFDDFNGTDSTRYGIGLDARLTTSLYAGLEASLRELDSPIVSGTSAIIEDREESLYRAYVSWAPLPRWAFDLEVSYEKSDNGISDNVDRPITIETISAPLFARYFHESGFFAELGVTVVNQELDRQDMSALPEGEDTFALLDGAIGYRLPGRFGIVSLEARNVFDENFMFQDNNFQTSEVRNPRFIPGRIVLGRATLSF